VTVQIPVTEQDVIQFLKELSGVMEKVKILLANPADCVTMLDMMFTRNSAACKAPWGWCEYHKTCVKGDLDAPMDATSYTKEPMND
jgi:hypothetical protein